jgi:hypothetical protein
MNVAIVVIIVIAIGIFGTRRPTATPPTVSSSASASASASAPPASSSGQGPASTAPSPSAPDLSAQSHAALVLSGIGVWESYDGTTHLYVDPARPSGSKKPRFHLIFERADKSGFGCDFDETQGPELADFTKTYRAWCGGEAKGKRRTMLGLTVDGNKLKLGLLVDATPMHYTLWQRPAKSH